jgi:hypothetical protein
MPFTGSPWLPSLRPRLSGNYWIRNGGHVSRARYSARGPRTRWTIFGGDRHPWPFGGDRSGR